MPKGKLLKPEFRKTPYYRVNSNYSTSNAYRISLHQDCGLKLHDEFAEILRPDGVIELIPRRLFKVGDYD